MHNAIILHGKPQKSTYFDSSIPSASNSIWIPWLQNELSILGLSTQTPEMPNSWQPDYNVWSKEFERYDINATTILIGHSMGGGFLVQWLSQHPNIRVGHVVLVAPSIGDRFTPNAPLDYPLLGGFGEFEVNKDLGEQTQSLTIFNSDNDGDRIQATVKYIRDNVSGITYREFHNYGHFRGARDMAGDAFPELLELIRQKL